MFWKITAISLGIACLILAYRNRRLCFRVACLLRANRVLQYGCKKVDSDERVVEFMGKGEE